MFTKLLWIRRRVFGKVCFTHKLLRIYSYIYASFTNEAHNLCQKLDFLSFLFKMQFNKIFWGSSKWQFSHCPEDGFVFCLLWSRKLWRSMHQGIILLHPLALPVSSSWPRRMEACSLASTPGPSINWLYSSSGSCCPEITLKSSSVHQTGLVQHL